jgi:hypothetical protein
VHASVKLGEEGALPHHVVRRSRVEDLASTPTLTLLTELYEQLVPIDVDGRLAPHR